MDRTLLPAPVSHSLEATGGFEPPNRGFADLRLRPLGYVALMYWMWRDRSWCRGRDLNPHRLCLPPPQDGVSTNSTTSAVPQYCTTSATGVSYERTRRGGPAPGDSFRTLSRCATSLYPISHPRVPSLVDKGAALGVEPVQTRRQPTMAAAHKGSEPKYQSKASRGIIGPWTTYRFR